jgi:energy-coupling factor transporter ATP-binding protein EcfA2
MARGVPSSLAAPLRQAGAAWSLVARDALVDDVGARLTRGTNVLLVGPRGVGKSAIVDVLSAALPVERIDPFECISRARAARLRVHLDHGATIVAAAETLDRRQLGAVGRILWRFQVVRVPPLPRAAMTLVIRHALPADVTELAGADAWIAALASYANGLPATGLAFAASGLSYWRQHGVLATVEWTIVDALARAQMNAIDRSAERKSPS